MSEMDTTRRAVMLGAGGAGLAVALTACGGYGTSATTSGGDSAGEPAASSDPGGKDAGSGAGGLAKTSDIPTGGGKIFKDEKIVITQPSDGQFKAFSALCTHQGCPVGSVSGGTINCPCHGSKFKISDGSVVDGPASRPLEEKQIKVDGDSISLA
ncbi:iron-sulfur protein [Sphaerisporangium melleum]|uniref:Cytochrome bc1 complex Rieske iron-sulfur subunit n=1 Tax=Sphaerisporangium melleum TaxID=321316 RepID=A0A917R2X7_9ACTN|nr:Rieske (2Fe-2S) protein [Sphaerisporangium melleum]GGK84353.1 iron-sulfur protein [Sphaerisporangium melleum]GII70395.1 iron-sulfur protein [Sphaerisporangium melleum]